MQEQREGGQGQEQREGGREQEQSEGRTMQRTHIRHHIPENL